MDASSTKQKPSAPAPLVDTRAVLSSPVAATATLPPPPPPRTAPIRTRVGAGSAPLAPTAPPPAAKAKETAPPTISAKSAATEAPPRETPPPERHTIAPPSSPLAPAGRVSPPPVAPIAPPSNEAAPVRGESIFGKRGGIKVLDAKTKRPAAEGRRKDQDGGSKPPERRGPGVRFAAMPEVKQPPPAAKAAEQIGRASCRERVWISGGGR